MKSKTSTTRREFITKTGIVTAGVTLGVSSLSAASYKRIPGANDRINMGFIGIGNRGSQLLNLFMKQPDIEVAALCDIYTLFA
ncbi:MAG TPA: twin-arginine translocation signal domain-containing protein [Bacteroidales bacterium]|nr:twin-arginine translocation signal domain-containing protein [Bacteroidales bacterium]